MAAQNGQNFAEFLEQLSAQPPVIPDEVTRYYLQRAGLSCPDPKVERLISLSAQKFVSEIADDAMQFAKIRQQGPSGNKKPRVDQPLILTMEDLSNTVVEYGITVRKPEYYADKVSAPIVPGGTEKKKPTSVKTTKSDASGSSSGQRSSSSKKKPTKRKGTSKKRKRT